MYYWLYFRKYRFDNVRSNASTFIWCKYDNSKKSFADLCKEYFDAVDRLAEQVIDYHDQVLVSSILHDAESHNWADTKEFFEVRHAGVKSIFL